VTGTRGQQWDGEAGPHGDSRIKVIDIATKSFVTTISTGGQFRVDEMAYDPQDHILIAANNADSPPFVTLFDIKTKTILGKMVFHGRCRSRRARRHRAAGILVCNRLVPCVGAEGRIDRFDRRGVDDRSAYDESGAYFAGQQLLAGRSRTGASQ
jgi:hypothetical protein